MPYLSSLYNYILILFTQVIYINLPLLIISFFSMHWITHAYISTLLDNILAFILPSNPRIHLFLTNLSQLHTTSYNQYRIILFNYITLLLPLSEIRYYYYHINQLLLYTPTHLYFRNRPYYADSTTSRPICEVKQRQARVVLRWVTTGEVRVLIIFFLPLLTIFLHKGVAFPRAWLFLPRPPILIPGKTAKNCKNYKYFAIFWFEWLRVFWISLQPYIDVVGSTSCFKEEIMFYLDPEYFVMILNSHGEMFS